MIVRERERCVGMCMFCVFVFAAPLKSRKQRRYVFRYGSNNQPWANASIPVRGIGKSKLVLFT